MDYEHDLLTRYESGELEDQKKEAIFDSTPYFTKVKGRIVYGGGGIYPDVFVPLDTSFSSRFLTEVASNALIGKFAYDYLDRNRSSITAIKDLETYAKTYVISNEAYQEFIGFAVAQGCQSPSTIDSKKSENFIKLQIKALMARQIWRDKGYYMVIQQNDKGLKAAVEALSKAE